MTGIKHIEVTAHPSEMLLGVDGRAAGLIGVADPIKSTTARHSAHSAIFSAQSEIRIAPRIELVSLE